jgi:hypothetical protein
VLRLIPRGAGHSRAPQPDRDCARSVSRSSFDKVGNCKTADQTILDVGADKIGDAVAGVLQTYVEKKLLGL